MAVYFIQVAPDGPVKIGSAGKPIRRLGEIQVMNHLPLMLRRQMPGGCLEERWLHRHFAHLRIRGEWFHPGSEMDTIIVPPQEREPSQGRSGMKLDQYLQQQRLSAQQFAATIGVSAEAVRLYIVGKRTPRADVLERIFEATDRQVRPDDFFDLGQSSDDAA